MTRKTTSAHHPSRACVALHTAVLGVLCLCALATAVRPSSVSVLSEGGARPWFLRSLPVRKRVAALMGQMTLAEKINMTLSDSPPIDRLGVPGYSFWSEGLHGVAWAGLSTVYPENIGLGATFAPDVVEAVAQQVSDEARAKHIARMRKLKTNDSAQFYGLHLFTPNVNIYRDPRWGRGQETFGECPTLVSSMSAAFIRGMQMGKAQAHYVKTVATCKHFLAYSLDSWDGDAQYRLRFDAKVSATDLEQTYLPAFRACVDADEDGVGTRNGAPIRNYMRPADDVVGAVRSVMCSYNAVNGIPACAHPMIQSTLRGRLGFDGFVISDCGAVEFIATQHKYTKTVVEAAAVAMNAGVDMDCGDAYLELNQAVASKLVNETTINAAVERILTSRFRLGMFDPSTTVPYNQIPLSVVNSAAHRQLARLAAQQSIVLLRNEHQTLPIGLRPNYRNLRNIAVIGPNADSAQALVGNYNGCQNGPNGDLLAQECDIQTPLAAITAAATTLDPHVHVKYEQGCDINSDSRAGFAAAANLAKSSDVVIMFLGLRTCTPPHDVTADCIEAEAHDRVNIVLPGQQESLLRVVQGTGVPVVLVLINGGPVSLSSWTASNVPAIVEAFYPGVMGGAAIADVLFGSVSPAGKMPVTVVTGLDQLPPYDSMQMNQSPGRTYRYLTQAPLYAFGYGLTYTTFNFDASSVTPPAALANATTTFTAQVSVTNVGSRPSDQVVQVYWRYHNESSGTAAYPAKQLVAFERIHLKVGQDTTLKLTFSSDDLKLVPPEPSSSDSSDRGGDVRAELLKGQYSIYIGDGPPGSHGAFVSQPGHSIEHVITIY
eukprot:TRINITY_DN66249_c4_g11_i1.p1 TRINITY_DN66249_c4_g11~~TRINITY_DN66249_c4_g11_i1.p1  ORF type:complete len:828 (-),score=378.61 TRINITY_DN66249_c4_g11_i1:109-2592(-)